jgi:tight adherence protein B
MPIPIPAIVFVAVLAVVFGAYWLLVVRPEEEQQRHLKKRLNVKRDSVLKAATGGLLKEAERLSEMPLFNRLLSQSTRVSAPVQRMLTSAGLRMTVGTLLLLSGVSGLAAYFFASYFLRAPLVGIPLGLAAAYLPFAYVSFMKGRRMTKFEEQFPEAIDLLARSLRAGHAFTTGVEMVGAELADPVGAEFRLMYDRQNFGMPMADTLRQFAERVPIIDARFFATAVLTQREAGGNLSEVLDNLAGVIRERFKVKRQVRVVTAHGRMTGWVLSGLPPALALALFLINPNQMMILVRDPLGVQMIIVAIVLQVVGTLVIRKLVDIEY